MAPPMTYKPLSFLCIDGHGETKKKYKMHFGKKIVAAKIRHFWCNVLFLTDFFFILDH